MMLSLSILSLVATLATALAVPLASRQGFEGIYTGLRAVRSASPIHLRDINATSNEFYIGLPTNAVCPIPAPECQGFPNVTTLTFYPEKPDDQAYLAANVPGGQNVYVKESGALSFTTPHTEYVFPPNSYTAGFEYTTDAFNVSFLSFTNGSATTWEACPLTTTTPTAYQVFANVVGFNNSVVPTGNTTDCLSFAITVANPDSTEVDLGAFQYD